MPLRSIHVFTGSANLPLAEGICRHLDVPLGRIKISKFSDGELFVEIGENVRGADVYVLQPMCTPVNDHIMELLIIVDALKRASAGSVTAVIPYYGYARQDRKVAPRTPITAKLVADLLTASGVGRVVSMDLHAGQIQGFFDLPFDHLYAMPVFVEALGKSFRDTSQLVMVSPDAGGVQRARAYAKRLNAGLAICDKRRDKPNESEVMNIIGDVSGRTVVLCDDIMDTAGTMVNAAAALQAQGASKVLACVTHPVLSGPALDRIEASCIERVLVTDTIPLSDRARASGRFEVCTVAKTFGEAVRRIHHADSVSSLFI